MQTDWMEAYACCIGFGITDPVFNLGNFHRLPVLFLKAILEEVAESRRQNINAKSIATAKLSSIVISALGGKSAKHKLDDFLPYEMPKTNKDLKISTKEAITWALKHEKLPVAIVGLIGAELG